MNEKFEPLTDNEIELLRLLMQRCGSENVLIEIQNIILENNNDVEDTE